MPLMEGELELAHKLQSSERGQMSIHSLVSVSLVCAWELEEGKAAGDIPVFHVVPAEHGRE